MAEGKPGETLIAFESGHYKKAPGVWKGDSVWAHFTKPDGGMVHVNKEKVEYMETFGGGNVEPPPTTKLTYLEEQKMEAEIDLLKAQAQRTRSDVAPEEEFKQYVTGFIKGVDERIHALEKSLQTLKNRMGQCA